MTEDTSKILQIQLDTLAGLAETHGEVKAQIMYLTGCTSEEIDRLGGLANG